MQRWIRRTAMAAVAAVTISGGQLAAQGTTPAPALSISGVGYAAWNMAISGRQHANAFDVTRTYLNFNAKFSGGVSTRVTPDIYRNADSSLAYRLKYGYVAYAPGAATVTYKFGLIQTPFISRDEDLWDYRMEGSIAAERYAGIAGGMSSADFGLSADAKLAQGRFDLNGGIYNGEGYKKAERDTRKDFMVRGSFKLSATDDNSATGGFRITGFASIGKPAGGGERNRYLGQLSYKTTRYTLAGEYITMQDSLAATPAPVKSAIISVFGVYHLPNSKISLIGRWDSFDPNTDVSNNKQTRIIAGASAQVSPNLRLLANVDMLSHEAGDPKLFLDPRNQALFTAQFSF
jgi:hypothetical protein